jgi:hypothetical protein
LRSRFPEDGRRLRPFLREPHESTMGLAFMPDSSGQGVGRSGSGRWEGLERRWERLERRWERCLAGAISGERAQLRPGWNLTGTPDRVRGLPCDSRPNSAPAGIWQERVSGQAFSREASRTGRRARPTIGP